MEVHEHALQFRSRVHQVTQVNLVLFGVLDFFFSCPFRFFFSVFLLFIFPLDSASFLLSPHSPTYQSLIAVRSLQPQIPHGLAQKVSEFKRKGIDGASPHHRFRVSVPSVQAHELTGTSIDPAGDAVVPPNRYTTDDRPPPPAVHLPSSVLRSWTTNGTGGSEGQKPTAANSSQQQPTAANRPAEPTRCA